MPYFKLENGVVVDSSDLPHIATECYSLKREKSTRWAKDKIIDFVIEQNLPDFANKYYMISDEGFVFAHSDTVFLSPGWVYANDPSEDERYVAYLKGREVGRSLAAKLESINSFWKYTARIMLIKNGHQQPIIADQEFVNNLESAKVQAEVVGYYSHQLRNEANSPVFENGAAVIVKIKKELLDKIGAIVQVRRGLCNRALAVHISNFTKLTNLEEIGNYDYTTNDEGAAIGSNVIQIYSSDNSDIYDRVQE